MPKIPKAEVTFTSNLKQVLAALDRSALQHMEQACQYMVNEMKQTLAGQRSGRRYVVPGLKTIRERQVATGKKLTAKQLEKRKYTASAPGEPPALRTGRLRNSIKYRLIGSGLSLKGVVGSALEYAPYLEFGTSHMAPRPFLRPTYERSRETIKQILGGKWL